MKAHASGPIDWTEAMAISCLVSFGLQSPRLTVVFASSMALVTLIKTAAQHIRGDELGSEKAYVLTRQRRASLLTFFSEKADRRSWKAVIEDDGSYGLAANGDVAARQEQGDAAWLLPCTNPFVIA